MTKPHSQQAYFRPRNWERWQNFRHARPAYIRNHLALLNDPKYLQLSDRAALALHRIWMLTAANVGPIPRDFRLVSRQINMSSRAFKAVFEELLSNDFIELCGLDWKPYAAHSRRPASLQTETETETETDPVPIGTDDATAPPSPEADLKARLFNGCLDWLAKQSETTTAKLRPMMGKWIADHGAAAVLDAALSAQREGAVEPVAYITRCLRPKSEQYRINSSEVDF